MHIMCTHELIVVDSSIHINVLPRLLDDDIIHVYVFSYVPGNTYHIHRQTKLQYNDVTALRNI